MTQVKKISWPSKIFDIKKPEFLIHQAVVTELANRRSAHAFFKNRALVSGGGIKPWKQKGTGRARQGSIRAPHWVGGGAPFGAHHREYSLKLNKKVRRKALAAALGFLHKEEKIFVFDSLDVEPKTKKAVEFFKKIGIEKGLVIDEGNKNLRLAVRNLPYFCVSAVGQVSVWELLKYENLVTTEKSWEELMKRIEGKVKNEASS